jgi:isopentenyl diphosphate isomerase/L-lactate dehydrogenase-like FMN-dependent dehydrogenase
MQRITIYGWIIQNDPIQGFGSGALCDLVYWVKDDLASVEEIFRIVENAGYKIISKKFPGTNIREKDRISVDNWNEHINIGIERMAPQGQPPERGYYDRYNPPRSSM